MTDPENNPETVILARDGERDLRLTGPDGATRAPGASGATGGADRGPGRAGPAGASVDVGRA